MEPIKFFERELRNRNYARNTRKIYTNYIEGFLAYADQHSQTNPIEVIASFIDRFGSPEQRRLAYSSIIAYYRFVLKQKCPYQLRKQKVRKRIPLVLERSEILAILDCIKNHRHRLIIGTIYAAGLRVSEVVKLKVADVNLSNMTLLIHDSKNHKDRVTILSKHLIKPLEKLIKDRFKGEFLFLNQSGLAYSVRTIQIIFTKALNKSGIQKKATCHTLRHSFATHLVESGISLAEIQRLLGHKSVNTTMIYVHLADTSGCKIVSPL
ncbi:MAG: tyrosine-type recombinase/integrase [Spirochaetales bacterium]|nr:tyrosine-type recombinase/integrase [Spirochaetales bacterium]